MKIFQRLASAAVVSGLMCGTALAAQYNFVQVAKIELPGHGGHGDWVSYDRYNGDVYFSLADSGVAVVDTKTNQVVQDIQGLDHPEGNAEDANYLYVACGAGPGKTNQLAVVSKATWQIVSLTNTQGTSPDGVQVDTAHHRVFVQSDDANTTEVYSEGANPKLLAVWKLQPSTGSGPDVGMYVPSKNRLYVPDDSQEEYLDANTGNIVKMVDTQVFISNYGGTKGQIFDPVTNQIWVGTTTGGIFVMNADTLKTIWHLGGHGSIDQVTFDPKLRIVYAFAGNAKGFDAYDMNTKRPLGFVSTGVPLTHTGDVDLANDDIYAFAGQSNEAFVYKPERVGQ